MGALAVDDEPTVFWDGTDAETLIAHWRAAIAWRDEWGSVTLAGGNGSSGRVVAKQVLTPLAIPPDRTYFTDCLSYYFVKTGPGSQGRRIAEAPGSHSPTPAIEPLPDGCDTRSGPVTIRHRTPPWDDPDFYRQQPPGSYSAGAKASTDSRAAANISSDSAPLPTARATRTAPTRVLSAVAARFRSPSSASRCVTYRCTWPV